MKKHLFFAAAFCAALCMASCGDDNIADEVKEQETEQQEEQHVPTQSIMKCVADTVGMETMRASYYASSGKFYIRSLQPVKVSNGYQYQYLSWIKIANDPGQDKWSGKYAITYADAYVRELVRVYSWWDFQPVCTASAGADCTETGDSWINFEDTGETERVYNTSTGKYDTYKVYNISLHIDELTEENGDYARDLNFSFRGKIGDGNY